MRSFIATFSSIVFASSGCSCRNRTTLSFTAGTSQPRTSTEPSLFFVWLSKTGSWSLTATAADESVAHVLAGEALLRELVHGLEHALAEGALVRPAVVRELAVHEGEVGLAVGVAVGEGELEALAASNAAIS